MKACRTRIAALKPLAIFCEVQSYRLLCKADVRLVAVANPVAARHRNFSRCTVRTTNPTSPSRARQCGVRQCWRLVCQCCFYHNCCVRRLSRRWGQERCSRERFLSDHARATRGRVLHCQLSPRVYRYADLRVESGTDLQRPSAADVFMQ